MEPLLYQSSTNHEAPLKAQYVGTKLAELPAPAAILDVATVRRNCKLMLDTAASLDIQFRAHIKTHKTIHGSQLQAGEEGPVRLVVSTVAELEHILPWLKDCIKAGREVNVLYGVPASASSLPRLAKLAQALGSASHISLMVDHPSILENIEEHRNLFPGSLPIFIKIDTGYNRAGVKPDSQTLSALCQKLKSMNDAVSVLGLYSHLGHSYGFSTPLESLEGLLDEFETISSLAEKHFSSLNLTLSVGATPTATAAQMLADSAQAKQLDSQNAILDRWNTLKKSKHSLEIHAGVYPFLDMQQLATQARRSNLSEKNIGLRVLVEVASLYSERAKPEALVAAGSLALGREPCKAYSGWGVVTPWSSLEPKKLGEHYSFQSPKGWIVGRISQEHGLLTWEGETAGMRELQIGEKLLVWPNHACVAGAGFGWYYIVDSDIDNGEVVHDVWVRCRGW